MGCRAFALLGCLWPRWCSGCRAICSAGRPLCVPVGGGPPASRPRHELRSARRLEAWPGPAAAHRHRGRSLRRPPYQRRLSLIGGSTCHLDARPGPAATAQVSRPDLTCRIAETAPNFARNSPATVSNTEFRSLELQRFRTLLKLCPIELRARFRGSCSCRPRYFARNSLECVSWFEV